MLLIKPSEDYDKFSPVGLYCAPAVHRTIGTFPGGTVRLSLGVFTTGEDVKNTVRAIEGLAKE